MDSFGELGVEYLACAWPNTEKANSNLCGFYRGKPGAQRGQVTSPGLHSFIPRQLPQSNAEVVIKLLFCLEPGWWLQAAEAAGASAWRWREQPLRL